MKDDMISRQAALDALDQVAQMFPYRIPGDAKTYRQYNEAWNDAIDAAETAIEALPTAESELENKIRAIGYTGKEGRIYIGGRLFAVRELPQ